jgi:hypothetical protein
MAGRRFGQRRRDEVAVIVFSAGQPRATREHPSSAVRDLPAALVECRGRPRVDHGAHVDVAPGGVANGEGGDLLDQARDQVLGDALLDIHARERRALLTTQPIRRSHDPGRGPVEVAARRDDARVLAAELHDAGARPSSGREGAVD